ncbi:MAG: outer membrane beta-barrel protein [Chitinophagaceae bacterium]
MNLKPLTVALCLLQLSSFAQSKLSVSFTVSDEKGMPLELAALQLYADSTMKLSAVTDSAGIAVFSLDTPGKYTLKVNTLGYAPVNKAIQLRDSNASFRLALSPSGKSLKEVVITQKKPLMRQEDDKTIVDAEPLAEVSTNGYEMLEKTPGLFVDQDGNIYLSSTTPATVYINGREMKMSRSDIASMLKNLPPNSIEKIEILRTPSAKYDASGGGGIVNVVLKKGVKIGLNGSVNTGFQQGVYGNRYAGISLNNNNGATSSYLNINLTTQNNYQQLNTNRVLTGDTLLEQKAFTKYPGQVAFTNYGISKDINDRWNLSWDGRLSYNSSKSNTHNDNNIVRSSTEDVLGSTLSLVDNNTQAFLSDQEIGAKLKIDTAGSEWVNRASYTYAYNNLDQVYNNTSVLLNSNGNGNVGTNRHYGVIQSDLTRKIGKGFTFETGLKSTYLYFTNDALYYTGGSNAIDPTRTNKYNYRENLNSLYVQGAKTFGGFILKAGLRMENTNMDGHQLTPGDTTFSIRRSDLFPYIYFSRKIMTIASYEIRAYLVARRTINRPTYEQLNPFPKYVDQFMSEIGNPTLKPQFTQNYEFNVSAGEKPLLAIGYNDTKDMFTNVFYQSAQNVSQAYRSYDNIGANKEFYLRGLAAIPPGKAYFAVIGGQYNFNRYEGLYEGKPLNFSGRNWLFFTYHQLKLDKRSTLSLHGFWRLAGPLQFYQLSDMGSLTLSINRKFLKDKLFLSMNMTDILYTNNNTFTVQQGSVNASGYRGGDTRRFGLTVRYNFGFVKKEEHSDMFQVDADGKK